MSGGGGLYVVREPEWFGNRLQFLKLKVNSALAA